MYFVSLNLGIPIKVRHICGHGRKKAENY